MPRLLLFSPCRKVIIDRDDDTVSLVSLLHGFNVNPVADQSEQIPKDAVIPFEWGIVTAWLRTPYDEGKQFEQRIEVVLPNSQVIGTSAAVPFSMTRRTHQNAIKGETFPAGIAGEYTFRLWLREAGEGNEWQVISEYPIEIRHEERPVPSE